MCAVPVVLLCAVPVVLLCAVPVVLIYTSHTCVVHVHTYLQVVQEYKAREMEIDQLGREVCTSQDTVGTAVACVVWRQ